MRSSPAARSRPSGRAGAARLNPGRTGAALLAAGLLLLAVVGCGRGTGGGATPTAGATGAAVRGTVTVFAAASLTESFRRIGKDFEAAHPGSTVVFNFAASSALATQIGQGAPADVFASAAPASMKVVTDGGNAAGQPVTFAKNQLVIAVPRGNPNRVGGLADLARPGLRVALCAPQVPCGAAAKQVIAAAKVSITPVTLEPDVKATLAKVRLGEVDAALVYRTDAKAASSDVDGIEFPESASAINDYVIVVCRAAPNAFAARAFVDHVNSGKGRSVLAAAGFQSP